MRTLLENVLAPDEATEKLLLSHPCVSSVGRGDVGTLRFSEGPWNREVRTGAVAEGPFGLMELIDNNPVVCADAVGIPSPAGTLALIALGPIVQAGLLIEAPTLLTNAPLRAVGLDAELLSIDWAGGITLETQELDLRDVYAATVIAAIQTPDDLEDIDDVYEERFGRSFFIRREEALPWDVTLVRGKPGAVYRLRIAPDNPASLLTIQVMADRDGKCGACQFVHAMNIMCGFEESLGIA